MRKLLFFLALVSSVAAFSQPIVERANQANTVRDARLAAKYNFGLPRYSDTTAANLQLGLDTCGALISTYDNTVWKRNCSPKQWVAIGSGGTITETDPIFSVHAAHTVTTSLINNWNTAYNKRIVSFSFTGSGTKTLTVVLGDGTTVSGNFVDNSGAGGNNNPDSLGGQAAAYYASVASVANKVDKVTGKQLSTEDYTTTEKTKLAGIQAGATANSSDATLLNRANHTGVEPATAITQDATHRFTTDAEKAGWDAKQAALGFVPLNPANNLSEVNPGTSRTNLGLGSVNNTSDANKPVSILQALELNKKLDTAYFNGDSLVYWVGGYTRRKAMLVPGGSTMDTTALHDAIYARWDSTKVKSYAGPLFIDSTTLNTGATAENALTVLAFKQGLADTINLKARGQVILDTSLNRIAYRGRDSIYLLAIASGFPVSGGGGGGGGGTNFALASNGATASAQSTGAGADPAAINDGDINSGWYTDQTGHYFQVDLGTTRSISEVRVWATGNSSDATNPNAVWTLYGALSYHVNTWNGSSWDDQGTVDNSAAKKNRTSLSFGPVSTTKIRITSLTCTDIYVRCNELEAY